MVIGLLLFAVGSLGYAGWINICSACRFGMCFKL